MPICSISLTFFITVHSFYENVQSNQSNTRDRKKTFATRANFFFLNPLLFFSARLFLVYLIMSLWSYGNEFDSKGKGSSRVLFACRKIGHCVADDSMPALHLKKKELGFPSAITWRWTSLARHPLLRIQASEIKFWLQIFNHHCMNSGAKCTNEN